MNTENIVEACINICTYVSLKNIISSNRTPFLGICMIHLSISNLNIYIFYSTHMVYFDCDHHVCLFIPAYYATCVHFLFLFFFAYLDAPLSICNCSICYLFHSLLFMNFVAVSNSSTT